MSISNVSNTFSSGFVLEYIDAEEQEIIRRLMAYGVTPSFNKSIDKAKLNRIEKQKAQDNNCVTGGFFTVSQSQEQEIQNKKKLKKGNAKKSVIPDKDMDFMNASDIIGRQILLAIRMKEQNKKSKKHDINNRKKYL